MLHDVIEGLVEVHQKRQIENHLVRRAQVADRLSEILLHLARFEHRVPPEIAESDDLAADGSGVFPELLCHGRISSIAIFCTNSSSMARSIAMLNGSVL